VNDEAQARMVELQDSLAPIIEAVFEETSESYDSLFAIFVVTAAAITGAQRVKELAEEEGKPIEAAMITSATVQLMLMSMLNKMADALLTEKFSDRLQS
jgi:hypothetical protein